MMAHKEVEKVLCASRLGAGVEQYDVLLDGVVGVRGYGGKGALGHLLL
jgi:hypothetical protein